MLFVTSCYTWPKLSPKPKSTSVSSLYSVTGLRKSRCLKVAGGMTTQATAPKCRSHCLSWSLCVWHRWPTKLQPLRPAPCARLHQSPYPHLPACANGGAWANTGTLGPYPGHAHPGPGTSTGEKRPTHSPSDITV
ncbi:hypothetical protein PQC31_gp52 [Pseudomonas phage Iggy]|uniref:Uncharacterized protein n=1 Tax=Pseudomonas phage Iggy TaxID=2592193 RepID=A0A7S5E9W0_9CAUD|nr:hypothetical protein PQC31_gp52 [Pseudomonas phage Iggy]QEA09773.1 hypothetical protein [Pseudomonas phage Iggy]